MSYIDWKKLKERVSLRDILDHYGLLGDLTEAAHGFEGVCPFCESRAFKANTEKNAWFCFGACKTKAEANGGQTGGNILDFVARMEEVSVKKAAELIAEWFLEYPAPSATGTRRSATPAQRKNAPTADAKKRLKKEGETDASRHRAPNEPAPKSKEIQDVPEAVAVGNGRERSTRSDDAEHLSGRSNPPLPFTLKSLDVEHPELARLGFKRATLVHFGAGYFTGKGLMHGKVALPFHNKDGVLVAYVGYTPGDDTPLYPKGFDRRLELFNALRAEQPGLYKEGLVLVTDILQVIRLHDLGVYNAIALPSAGLHVPQLSLMEAMVGEGGRVDFIPGDQPVMETLETLATRFYTRVHRDLAGSPAEFLPKIAAKLGCR